MTEPMADWTVNVDEALVPDYVLPDPLLMPGGESVRDAAAWEKRRAETSELFRAHVYGRTPGGAVETRATVTAGDETLSGRAVRKGVRLDLSAGQVSIPMDLLCYLPAGARPPVPAFLGRNFWGNHSITADPAVTLSRRWMPEDDQHGIVGTLATERSRGIVTHRWPVEAIPARGYGLIPFTWLPTIRSSTAAASIAYSAQRVDGLPTSGARSAPGPGA